MRVLVTMVGIGAVVVAGALAYLNLVGTEVVVTNGGPNPIRVGGALPAGAAPVLAVLGVRGLPDELRPGVPVTVRVPRLAPVDVDATAPGAVTVAVLGRAVTFGGACDSVALDGAALLGRRTTVDLGARARHDLQLACL
jgi:hypothetical protein